MNDMFKKILVPTDISENSRQAFRCAIDLAEKHNAEIYVLSVVNIGYLEEAGKIESNRFHLPHSYIENLMKERTRETDEFIKKNSENKKVLKIERYIRKGYPLTEIIGMAKEKEVDLIVMGCHGRTGLSHVLMGSVAEKVVRKAPCPVLTVKPKGYKSKAA
jgi:nucleotide-binding universal stress UspA family protein